MSRLKFIFLLTVFCQTTLAETTWTAIINARVVDVESGGVSENHTVLIKDNIIEAYGPSKNTAVPEEAVVIDAQGKTLLPGLVMLHEHFFYSDHLSPEFHVRNQSFAFPRLYLAAGITTARTGASIEPYTDLALADASASGEIPGPDFDVTSPLVGGAEPLIRQAVKIRSSKEALEFVNFWADAGVDSYKIYMSAAPELVKATVDAAHKRNLKVTGHLCATTYEEAAKLGIDNLEHGFFASTDFVSDKKPGECSQISDEEFVKLSPDQRKVKKLYSTLIENNVAITSTLAVFASGSTEHNPLDPGTIDALSPAAIGTFMDYRSKTTKRQQDLSVKASDVLKAGMALELGFYRAGGTLVIGTDPTGPGGVIAGFGSHWAMILLHEAGFTPMEVLKIATMNGARYLQRDQDIGSIKVGKRADLMLVDGKPDLNIEDIRKVETVYKAGVAYDSNELREAAKDMVGGPVGRR